MNGMKVGIAVAENVEQHRKFVVMTLHLASGEFTQSFSLDSNAAKIISAQLLDAARECESRIVGVTKGN